MLESSRSQPIPEGVASEWLNEDSMIGAAPYKAPQDQMTSNGYKLENAAYDNGGGDLVVDIVALQINVLILVSPGSPQAGQQ